MPKCPKCKGDLVVKEDKTHRSIECVVCKAVFNFYLKARGYDPFRTPLIELGTGNKFYIED